MCVLVVFFFPFLKTEEHTMTTDELCNATDCNLYNKLSFITKLPPASVSLFTSDS